MAGEDKRGRGRPRQGEPVLIRLPEEQLAWLDRQPGSRAEVIRGLIAAAMQQEG
jgi:hypothetical protein